MKALNKRLPSLTAVLVALCLSVSCGAGDTNNPQTITTAGDTTPSETTSELINWESANLPVIDYGGREFTVLTRETTNKAHTWFLVAPDELNGDTLNDQMFNRNKKIEELYNISLSSYYSTNIKTDASNAINAGDNTYSAVFGAITDTFQLAQEGYFQNFYNLDYIDLDAQWWDQSVVRDLSYKDQLYTLTGDISPAANVRVYVYVFNKDLCEELGLALPYADVLGGTWTMERFNQYITNVNFDVNGDSVMDYEDRWGFFSETGYTWMVYFSNGGKVVTTGSDGELEIAYNTESNIKRAVSALEIAIDKTKTLFANKLVNDNGGNWPAATAWFASGKALFRSTTLEPVPRDLRSLDVNFGIVPFPKLDENQKQYYTMTEPATVMFSVPVTADADFAGLILESLAAESVSTVSPAFYDTCLNGKVLRDNESQQMLDIIFANKTYDIGLINNTANFRSMLQNLEANGSTDVASAFASSLTAADTSLKKIGDNFDALK